MIKENNIRKLEKKLFKIINEQIDKRNFISVLLLIHSAIEAYLLSILLYTTNSCNKLDVHENKKVHNKILENVQKAGFRYLLNVNFLLCNISIGLYKRIDTFHNYRNKIVHELVALIDNPQTERNLKKQIKNGKEILEQLSKIHNRKMREKAEKYSQ